MDDDDDADIGDVDETQDAEETEILEETDGSPPPFVSLTVVFALLCFTICRHFCFGPLAFGMLVILV
jgi:hypothetical protein